MAEVKNELSLPIEVMKAEIMAKGIGHDLKDWSHSDNEWHSSCRAEGCRAIVLVSKNGVAMGLAVERSEKCPVKFGAMSS